MHPTKDVKRLNIEKDAFSGSLSDGGQRKKRFCSKHQNTPFPMAVSDYQITILEEHTPAPKNATFIQVHRDNILGDTLDSDKISVGIHHYNNLKTRVENAERLKVFLDSFKSLWKTECTQSKKEVNKAFISSEYKQICFGYAATPCTAMFQNESKKNTKTMTFDGGRSVLKMTGA